MKWASALSEQADTTAALLDVVARVRATLDGASPDLMIVFCSPHHQAAFSALPEALAEAFPGALLVGCSAGGVIGDGREVEERAALSLTAAVLPGVTLTPFQVGRTPGDDPHDLTGLPAGSEAEFLVLADPFSCDAQALIDLLDGGYPAGHKVGGLASGARSPGGNALFLGRETHRHGAVAVGLSGDVVVDTLVAQGCRAIGRPMPITACEGNMILALDKRRPVDVLRELHESLGEADKRLMRTALHVGIEMNERSLEFRQGEFLVRNLVGVDPERGAVQVASKVRPWQVVQFLLRDARTAEEDLVFLLERYRDQNHPRASGALLFSCLGRGKGLFGVADHDTGLFRARLGAVPLGGFFCNGEIGPVGGKTFLHGYTSAFGLFRSKS